MPSPLIKTASVEKARTRAKVFADKLQDGRVTIMGTYSEVKHAKDELGRDVTDFELGKYRFRWSVMKEGQVYTMEDYFEEEPTDEQLDKAVEVLKDGLRRILGESK